MDIQTSCKIFLETIVAYYPHYQSRMGLSCPRISCRYCATATFTGKHGMACALYGPPEWHLETYFISHGVKWNFGDVVGVYPAVMDWMLNNRKKHSFDGHGKDPTLELEVDFFYILLTEMMPRIKEFAWIGNGEWQDNKHDTSLGMTHEECIEKLFEYRKNARLRGETHSFRKHIIPQAEIAWKIKDYAGFVALVSPHVDKLTKAEIAKLNYSKKHIIERQKNDV